MKIAITSNSSWNLYNFRKGFISHLIDNNHQVIIIAPKDKYSNLSEPVNPIVFFD